MLINALSAVFTLVGDLFDSTFLGINLILADVLYDICGRYYILLSNIFIWGLYKLLLLTRQKSLTSQFHDTLVWLSVFMWMQNIHHQCMISIMNRGGVESWQELWFKYEWVYGLSHKIVWIRNQFFKFHFCLVRKVDFHSKLPFIQISLEFACNE